MPAAPSILFVGDVVGGLGRRTLLGLLPALRLSGADPIAWLTHRGTGGAAPHMRTGRALVAVQIAVSVPLVVGAILFLRTLANLAAVELGFDPNGILLCEDHPLNQELIKKLLEKIDINVTVANDG